MNTEKRIEDYLHLYPKCPCTYDNIREVSLVGVVTPKIIEWGMYGNNYSEVRNVKLHLRPLSDMSEEEQSNEPLSCFEGTRYLLSKHFDLFGLIEVGLAIDATTLKSKQL